MKAGGQATAVLDPKRADAKKDKGQGEGKGKDDTKKSKGKGGHAGSVSRVQFPDKLCPDLQKGRECKYGKECRYSHDKKKFKADGSAKKGVAACDSKAEAAEEVDWEPPAGLAAMAPRAGRGPSRSGGMANPFAFGPLWLGQGPGVEMATPETLEAPSRSQLVGLTGQDVGRSKKQIQTLQSCRSPGGAMRLVTEAVIE